MAKEELHPYYPRHRENMYDRAHLSQQRDALSGMITKPRHFQEHAAMSKKNGHKRNGHKK